MGWFCNPKTAVNENPTPATVATLPVHEFGRSRKPYQKAICKSFFLASDPQIASCSDGELVHFGGPQLSRWLSFSPTPRGRHSSMLFVVMTSYPGTDPHTKWAEHQKVRTWY